MNIELYTDGGCRGNQADNNIGAWGAYMTYGEHIKEVSGGVVNTTNNIMELIGCIEGLKAIHNKDIPVIVHLDSAYVLNGITNWIIGWKAKGWINSKKEPVANKELWIALDLERAKFKDIQWVKVKGHSDNYGNNQADRLCNEYMDWMKEKFTEYTGGR
ncbi:MAG: ribonuclease H family protein [Paraclostridium sp.]